MVFSKIARTQLILCGLMIIIWNSFCTEEEEVIFKCDQLRFLKTNFFFWVHALYERTTSVFNEKVCMNTHLRKYEIRYFFAVNFCLFEFVFISVIFVVIRQLTLHLTKQCKVKTLLRVFMWMQATTINP